MLLALLLAATPAAHGQQDELEVRVAAQRLADGRTEFALQERQANGSWGERRLPRARFFPASTRVGRWLGSSPLTIDVQPDGMQTAAGDSGLEVRVAAQLLSDGRMEFALQEREPDGSWAERRLPRARFFPASPQVGRWLASSPLTVSLSLGADAAACTPEAVAARVTGSVALVRTSQGSGTAFYIGGSEWITAEHVVRGATSAQLRNSTLNVNARVVGLRADVDLAVLHAPTSALAFRWGEVPPRGAATLVLGYGRGQRDLDAGMTDGIVSELYDEDGQSYVRTSASANPGNSGGPLLDVCGNVIGVIQSKYVDEAVEGVAYAIAGDSAQELLPSVRTSSPGRSSAPTATSPSTLTITAFCTGDYDSSAACRASAASGLDPSAEWEIWVVGVEDWDNAYYSLDGARGVAEDGLTLQGLAPGQHTLRIVERQSAGWTEWSEPYEFTIRDGPATLEITAFCASPAEPAEEQCHNLSRSIDPTVQIWVFATGWLDWDSLLYSFNRADSVAGEDVADQLLALPSGCHKLQIAESGISTHWSAPYEFCLTESGQGPSVPTAPTGLRLTKIEVALGPDDLRLSWNPVAGATFYDVYHHAAGYYFDYEATVTTTSYVDEWPNILYVDSYIVVACNDAGCSPDSDIVTEQ